MNTRINYMYRDASNYKSFNVAVVNGILSATDCNTIYHCCLEGGERYFIPHMVGLPEKTFADYGKYEDDHPWFEIGELFYEYTNAPATVDLTAEQLLKNFLAMKGRWEDAVAQEMKEAQENGPAQKLLAACAESTVESSSTTAAQNKPASAGTRYSIRMQTTCFAPTVTMSIDVPKDRDAEEYIDEYLDAILSEEARANCEWDFV